MYKTFFNNIYDNMFGNLRYMAPTCLNFPVSVFFNNFDLQCLRA